MVGRVRTGQGDIKLHTFRVEGCARLPAHHAGFALAVPPSLPSGPHCCPQVANDVPAAAGGDADMAEAASADGNAENQPANAAAGAEPASTVDKVAAGDDAPGPDAAPPPQKKATKVPQQKYNNVKVKCAALLGERSTPGKGAWAEVEAPQKLGQLPCSAAHALRLRALDIHLQQLPSRGRQILPSALPNCTGTCPVGALPPPLPAFLCAEPAGHAAAATGGG